MSSTKPVKTLRAPVLSLMLERARCPARQRKSKSCNPIHHRLQKAGLTEADTDLRLIDITGQIVVSAWPGLAMFILELTHHQSLGAQGRSKSSETALSWIHANIIYTCKSIFYKLLVKISFLTRAKTQNKASVLNRQGFAVRYKSPPHWLETEVYMQSNKPQCVCCS